MRKRKPRYSNASRTIPAQPLKHRLIPFSRNLLGVHTPQDVLVGLGVGFLALVLTLRLEGWVEGGQDRDLKAAVGAVVLVVAHLLYVSLRSYETVYAANGSLLVDPVHMVRDCYALSGVFLGTVGGWLLERRRVGFTMDCPVWVRVLRGAVGVPVFLLLMSGCKQLTSSLHPWASSFCTMAVIFFFIAGLWPLIFTQAEKRMVKKSEVKQ